ncbi:uncharacterized protein EMH_0002160 [Eimeria mitis]|uniref:FAM13A-like domain-containing protein n=1 Tax=Eimeria mitis TaxID=44415 RepID=U6KKF3_9EIME|nr:uncharacterized protein EMH_0002160 [Eimeria mitis]CDJ35918.1 hypothetical protein, conserved [Eimeria mitis]
MQAGRHVNCCPPDAPAAVCARGTAAGMVMQQQEDLSHRVALAVGGPVQQGGAATSAGAAEQHRNSQPQRQSQMLRQQKPAAAAKTNKEKGIKRRPEQQGPLHGASRAISGASAAAASPAAQGPPLHVVGGPVARADGPPQKRQAVGRRRGETAAGVRSSSSNSSSNSSRGKAAGGGGPHKSSVAARGSSAGGPQSSSCRPSTTAKASPPQPMQQQENGGLQESSSDIEATESGAAAAAVAAARCSSSNSGADAAVSAFAAEWLRGCQQRLEETKGKPREDNVAGASGSTGHRGLRDTPPRHSSSAASSFNPHEEQQLQLQKIKKQLKQELRAYNAAFTAHFGRQPLKQDKEPLRPVYMHYQRIKQRLEQHLLVAAEENRPSEAATNPAESSSVATEVSSSAAATTRRNTTDICSPPAAASPTGAAKRIRRQRSSVRSVEALSPKAAHRGVAPSSAPKSPGKAKEKQTSTRPSAFEIQQQLQRRREEMALQLHQLQRERRLLGDKLAAYHLRFKQEHGRPLRLKADIAPVHEEYKLFVEITKQIDGLAFALQKQTL